MITWPHASPVFRMTQLTWRLGVVGLLSSFLSLRKYKRLAIGALFFVNFVILNCVLGSCSILM